jgi:hypothetical protein
LRVLVMISPSLGRRSARRSSIRGFPSAWDTVSCSAMPYYVRRRLANWPVDEVKRPHPTPSEIVGACR